MIKKKSTTASGLLNTLEKHSETALNDAQRVRIAKKKYLMANKEEILQAVAEGYNYPIIAEAATIELLKTGVTKEFVVTNKEGEEVSRETKYRGPEVREFCEAIDA
ncbi:hypothetical protein [Paraglaciecola sp. MB-3u-78]|uniref:hypothetical protein n=1 Tax=Paraglaciecola sp. MB-3u-78 TaxID=2058332 RepID=UPI000C345EBC|nr:hypothetical protein [Paraglaciecola sp. MB-3u-78]PKG95072.1 hypothetical protein CXF95_26145 [Paraglaciecola sp. MB-3u-78]